MHRTPAAPAMEVPRSRQWAHLPALLAALEALALQLEREPAVGPCCCAKTRINRPSFRTCLPYTRHGACQAFP